MIGWILSSLNSILVHLVAFGLCAALIWAPILIAVRFNERGLPGRGAWIVWATLQALVIWLYLNGHAILRAMEGHIMSDSD